MAGITIDDLPSEVTATVSHLFPAMKDGFTVHLSVDQVKTLIIAAITDSAPATLDTLNELAAALGDDPNFATTITGQIALKLAITDLLVTWANQAHTATAKTTPVAADEVAILDSASGFAGKRMTVANFFTNLFADWSTQAHAATAKATPVLADEVAILDSAAAFAGKRSTLTSLLATLTASQLAPVLKVYTAGATWTKPAGLKAAFIQVQAPGGGGGYGASSASNAAVGGGGASGQFSEVFKLAAALGATETVTIGAPGVGGVAAGATPATSGGNASFGAHATAVGGGFGLASSPTATPGASASGGSGPTGTIAGDRKVDGQDGSPGQVFAAGFCFGGDGGDSLLGLGGRGKVSNSAGAPGRGFGAGGAGGAGVNNGNGDGGAGAPGIVYVWEFF